MALKSNKEEFIRKAKKIHGDKYDYSKVEYTNNYTKVCIICHEKDKDGNEHGEFWQIPASHLSKRGCPKCKLNKLSKSLRTPKNDFITKARSVHGDKYDYSKVEYVNNRVKVCIICPIHGEFWQTPTNHIGRKSGCPKCKSENLIKRNTRPWVELVNNMRKTHGDKFEYDETTYINSHKKIRIVCPIHGEFWQTPNHHLGGGGCPRCGGKSVYNIDDFLVAATKVHNKKYDYSKVEYKNTDSKVCIICPMHGEFWQTPHSHLEGAGCPICNESRLEKETASYLDKINIQYERGKHFHWLGRQHLDFYIPCYNMAIECQGEQHFGISGWAKNGRFKNIRRLDVNKKQLCEKYGVKLYYFSHQKFDEFLGEKLYNDITELIEKATNIGSIMQ